MRPLQSGRDGKVQGGLVSGLENLESELEKNGTSLFPRSLIFWWNQLLPSPGCSTLFFAMIILPGLTFCYQSPGWLKWSGNQVPCLQSSLCLHSREGMVKQAFLQCSLHCPSQRFWFSKSGVGVVKVHFWGVPGAADAAGWGTALWGQLLSTAPLTRVPCSQDVAPLGYFSQKPPLDLP